MWKKKTAEVPIESQPVPAKQVSKEEQVREWEVKQYPTQVTDVLVNNKTGQQLDVLGALAELLNRTEE